MPDHLSLSLPLDVNPEKVNALQDDLKQALKDCPALSSPLSIPLGPRLEALPPKVTAEHPYGKYIFVGMMVPVESEAETRIAEVISCLDKVVARYAPEKQYNSEFTEKKYHVSVGWCLSEPKRADDLNQLLEDTYRTQVTCPLQENSMKIEFPPHRGKGKKRIEYWPLWTQPS
eukprot:gene16558-22787_t